MSTKQKKNSRFNALIVPAFCALLLGYFAYHAQNGRYSINTKEEMEIEAQRLKFVLTDLRAKREGLERNVGQLTDGSLEKDALDEQARRALGYVSANEVVILR